MRSALLALFRSDPPARLFSVGAGCGGVTLIAAKHDFIRVHGYLSSCFRVLAHMPARYLEMPPGVPTHTVRAHRPRRCHGGLGAPAGGRAGDGEGRGEGGVEHGLG